MIFSLSRPDESLLTFTASAEARGERRKHLATSLRFKCLLTRRKRLPVKLLNCINEKSLARLFAVHRSLCSYGPERFPLVTNAQLLANGVEKLTFGPHRGGTS